MEKALADQDPKVRYAAARPLGKIGGEKARDLLIGRLAGEKDREVLKAVRVVLERYFANANDPAVVKALKDFKLPEDPKSQPPPKP
jgi:HEAT repeat protein